MTRSLRGKDVLSILDLSPEEARETLDLARKVKASPKDYARALAGQVMVMIFEKPSLRTRVTFETGMATLGGTVIYLSPDQVRMGDREPVRDVARNLERMVQVIVGRTFSHDTLEELAKEGDIPVINALSDREHPCQALADIQTVQETFGEEKISIAYVGDGNNVCHSLLLLGAMLGYDMRVATPSGYEPRREVVAQAGEFAARSGGRVCVSNDPHKAVAGARILYTDVWTSMGQEEEREKRAAAFQGFQLNADLLSRASAEVRVLHCLPAHRGEEITDEVIEAPNSLIFDQAENRLHSQKALLLQILGE